MQKNSIFVFTLVIATQLNLNLYINIIYLVCAAITLYNHKFSTVESILILSFLSFLFDHDQFTYTNLNLRLGYVFLPFLYYYIFKNLNMNYVFLLIILGMILYAAISIVLSGQDKLLASKFMLISLPFFLSFYIHQKNNDQLQYNISSFSEPFIIFGVLQIIDLLLNSFGGFNLNLLANQSEYAKGIRPSAFFSETTWFSILAMYVFCFSRSPKWDYMASLGIFASLSRMTLLPLTIYLTIASAFSIKNFLRSVLVITALIIIDQYTGVLTFSFQMFMIKLDVIFSGNEQRLDAYRYLISQVTLTTLLFPEPFSYGGFHFDNGSTVGAKSFSLPFYLMLNFGFVGFVAFILFSFKMLVQPYLLTLSSRRILFNYTIYLCALVGPVFQMPFGIAIIAILLSNRK